MQFPPSPHIAHIVRHYLVLRGAMPGEAVHRLFADGNTGIVFNLAGTGIRLTGKPMQTEPCWLYGQLSSYQDFSLSGTIDWIVVVLHPYAAHQLWQMPATEWKDHFFPAKEVLGPVVDNICIGLSKAATVQDRIDLLDRWIFHFSGNGKQTDPLLQQAIQQINASEGALSVHSLLQQLRVSERMLERKFKLTIGLSPKQYSGIVRMNASAKKLKRFQDQESLTSIAYEADFFDQAHFIRDFRKYTGITPWQYQHTVDPLALNFLRF
ncbi:MAG: helix-turn-helix transcriptional regulator [Chitinophagaceae bacterium]|nr:helix-turn-helix transcriptional regulator [Chitinophagaceae bacterium]